MRRRQGRDAATWRLAEKASQPGGGWLRRVEVFTGRAAPANVLLKRRYAASDNKTNIPVPIFPISRFFAPNCKVGIRASRGKSSHWYAIAFRANAREKTCIKTILSMHTSSLFCHSLFEQDFRPCGRRIQYVYIGHRRLRSASAFVFSDQAARFQPKPVEPHQIDAPVNCGQQPHPGKLNVLQIAIVASASRNTRCLLDEP
jgi:hypothetical protein